MTDFVAQPATLANSTTAGDQIVPVTAALAGGGYVVVWTSTPSQQNDHADDQVFAQVYDAAGQRVGGEIQVFADTTHPHEATGVAGLADGSFVVAATSIYGTSAGVSFNALAQHVAASGQPIGDAATVRTSDTSSDQVSSTGVYGASDGGYYVGVSDSNISARSSYASLQHYDASGAATGGTIASVSDDVSSRTANAAVIGNGDIVTTTETTDLQGTRVNWEQFTPSGTVVSTMSIPTSLSAGGHPEAHPVVAALAGGNSVLVWNDVASSMLKVQLMDDAGHAVGAPATLATQQDITETHVDALAGGAFLVSYLQVTQPSQNLVQLVAQQFDASGDAVGAELQLSPQMSDNTFQPHASEWDVAATPDGGFVVTYNTSGTGEDIVQQKWNVAAATTPGTIQGTTGDDHLVGTSGNDRLDGVSGNDTLDGGAGTDTAVIETSVSGVQSYSIGAGGITVTTSLGTDTLVNIERVQFSDALFALDTNPGGHVWEAAALFHAGFGVLPGMEDLSHWTAQADQSTSMGDLAQKMIDSYAPGVSSSDLVAYLYQQLTHQAPTADVVQSYVDQIGPGKTFATQGELLAYAANLSLNTDGIASIVGTVQQLDPHAF
jgi:hypothetical protein